MQELENVLQDCNHIAILSIYAFMRAKTLYADLNLLCNSNLK